MGKTQLYSLNDCVGKTIKEVTNVKGHEVILFDDNSFLPIYEKIEILDFPIVRKKTLDQTQFLSEIEALVWMGYVSEEEAKRKLEKLEAEANETRKKNELRLMSGLMSRYPEEAKKHIDTINDANQ